MNGMKAKKQRRDHWKRQRQDRCRGGKREDLGDTYFRSSWEANWARYLNWLKDRGDILSWEYESETFEFHHIKKGSRFYTPDFKVTEKDGRVIRYEIKGYMDQRSSTKLARMFRFYPESPITLIRKQQYDAVRKTLSRIIPGWE